MKTRSWQFSLPILIFWLAFGVRLYRLDFQSIWWDEGHSIFVAAHTIPQIPTIPAMDVHPPAYFSLLHLWLNLAGQSEFALRFLSVIFSMLTVALLWRFAGSITRRTTPNRSFTPVYTALLAALSPLYVAYAQEVRSYAMITFLALASTYFLWRIIFLSSGPISRRWPAISLYIIATAACLYTHYFTIFLLLFQNLAWLVWVVRGQRSAADPQGGMVKRLTLWGVSQIGVLLLFAPQLLLALRQVTSYTNPNLVPPTLSHFISRSWRAYTVGLTINDTPARWGVWLMAGVLAVIWLVVFIQIARQKIQNSSFIIHNFLFLLAWFSVPLAAYFIVLQRQPSFEPRYMILVTPALFLLLSYASLVRPHALRYLCYTLPLIIFIIGLDSYYTDETTFKDDSAGVADWLAAETTTRDIVYIDVPHPFHYYVEQRAIAAPTRYLFVDIHTAAELLTAEAAGHDRLFWVTWQGSDTDPRGVIPFLAEKFGRQLGQLDFRGYRVTWFSLPRSGTHFSLPTTLTPMQAMYGDVLRLDGAAYGGHPPEGTAITAGESAWATLHFTLLRDTDTDYRVSLRLRGEDGQLVAQTDKDLLNDRHFRTSAWPVDDPALNQALNVYTLLIPSETAPGIYHLEVVVYNARPPYPSEGVTGHESNDSTSAVLGNITVTP